MGREINVNVSDTLNIQDAATAIAYTYRAILIDAFDQRQREVGGQGVMLDAVIEIAVRKGYPGTQWAAQQLLGLEGRFIIEPGPSGRLVIRRASDSL